MSPSVPDTAETVTDGAVAIIPIWLLRATSVSLRAKVLYLVLSTLADGKPIEVAAYSIASNYPDLFSADEWTTDRNFDSIEAALAELMDVGIIRFEEVENTEAPHFGRAFSITFDAHLDRTLW